MGKVQSRPAGSAHPLCHRHDRAILQDALDLDVIRLESGPLGGDQQIGAKICEGDIDFVIFFWDPLEPQPHDPDVKALLRIAVVWNIPVACNRTSADFMISSSLNWAESYNRLVPDYTTYKDRFVESLSVPAGADGAYKPRS